MCIYMKKKSNLSTQTFIRRASINLFFSDGEGFSQPHLYRGYYVTYAEYDPKTCDFVVNTMQRILSKISEQTTENDKLAVEVFKDFTNGVGGAFDRHLGTKKVNVG
jgi:hypothetical protein